MYTAWTIHLGIRWTSRVPKTKYRMLFPLFPLKFQQLLQQILNLSEINCRALLFFFQNVLTFMCIYFLSTASSRLVKNKSNCFLIWIYGAFPPLSFTGWAQQNKFWFNSLERHKTHLPQATGILSLTRHLQQRRTLESKYDVQIWCIWVNPRVAA